MNREDIDAISKAIAAAIEAALKQVMPNDINAEDARRASAAALRAARFSLDASANADSP